MISPRKELADVMPYTLHEARKNKVRLDLNEPLRECSPRVMEAIKTIGSDDISSYPDYSQLIEKISSHLGIRSENILLTNGANEAIRVIMETYIEKEDEIVLPCPTFSMYEIMARVRGARITPVLYDRDFSFPKERLLSESGKLIVVVNPGSPTGTCIDKKDFVEILEKMNGSLVVLDETYYHFVGESYVDLINEFDNLVVIHTFSKAFGLAGLRLGFLVSDARNIQEICKVISPFSVNAVAVVAGATALEDTDYTEQIIKEVEQEKKILCKNLTNMGLKAKNTKTNFILVCVGECVEHVHTNLRNRNILVKNISDLPLMNGYLRVTVGTRSENTLFVNALKEILPPEAILFDMDGVLVDVSESYRRAIKKTVEYFLKKVITSEEIEEYKTKEGYNNDWDLTEAIVSSFGVTIPRGDIINTFQEFYLGSDFNGFIKNEKWLLGIFLLKKLANRYKLGIVTGRSREETKYTLNRFDVEEYFDVLVTMEDVKGRDKPDPGGITMALQRMNVKRAVYVGDTINDVRAAVAAEVIPVIVTRNKNFSGKKEANHILENVNDIGRVIL